MHDSVALEELGVATAVIVTREFARESVAQSSVLGMPQLGRVLIDHPLSSLSSDQILGRAAQAMPQAMHLWLGKLPGSPAGA